LQGYSVAALQRCSIAACNIAALQHCSIQHCRIAMVYCNPAIHHLYCNLCCNVLLQFMLLCMLLCIATLLWCIAMVYCNSPIRIGHKIGTCTQDAHPPSRTLNVQWIFYCTLNKQNLWSHVSVFSTSNVKSLWGLMRR
jgi:hypothetical protein